jgi:hypothetical protein
VSLRPLANLLSASTTDFPAAPAPPSSSRSATAGESGVGRALRSARNFYLGLLVVSLVVGAVSLLIPSTPSYDPWSWLVWGREIIHVNLVTTGGPTWKPLPVIFTTVFALFGKAQPDLWLVIARAGAFAAVVMVFRLGARLTRQIGLYFTSAAAETGDAGNALLAWLPGLLAGTIAAVGLAFSGGYISSNALGYSEGLATAAILIALELHLDGKPRHAFVLGFLGALDRPEMWLFWGPYGLWLYWKDAGARKLVIGLFVAIPILWFLPEYWGSGHLLRGATRATHVRSNSLALAKCPFCSELKDAAWPTVLFRIKIAAIALILVVGALLAVRGRRDVRGWLADRGRRAQMVAATAGLLGLAWFVVISVMTQIGFSGNNRYLVIGSALLEICGGVAWGWVAAEIGGLLLRGVRRRREAPGGSVVDIGRLAAVGAVGLVFLFVPSWLGRNLLNIPATHRSLVYQASLRTGAHDIVAKYGGAKKLLRCGSVMTEGFQVPMVAWTLDVHTKDIQAPPPAGTRPPSTAPNVILQTRASRNLALLPYLSQWPTVHYRYIGHSGPFRLFTHCA